MLEYLPFYNKFRAPSMALVIPQICIPILAVLTLSKLVNETDYEAAFKKLRNGAIAAAAVLVLLGAFWTMADYTGKGDADIKKGFVENFSRGQNGQQDIAQGESLAKEIMTAIRSDRKHEAGMDLLRTFLFIAAAVALVALVVKKKISPLVATVALTILSLVDIIGVDKRYLNYDDFREKEEVTDAFTPSAADTQIKNDPDHANFRVFNQSGNFTNESVTSYHHNSIGGYHPAKLGLYQDLIETQIGKGNMGVLNMLNTKYFIGQGQNGQPIAQLNPGAFGPCWLVKGIKFVTSVNNEMLALDSTNLRDTAVVNESFKASIKQLPVADSLASIKISERQNDKITYAFNASAPQFAVLSEIYYNRGWNAYIDGQNADYVKTNYALRGIAIPAGKHTVDFRFEPTAYKTGNAISFWGVALIYLILAIALFLLFKKKKN